MDLQLPGSGGKEAIRLFGQTSLHFRIIAWAMFEGDDTVFRRADPKQAQYVGIDGAHWT